MTGNSPNFLDPDRPDAVRLDVADAAELGEKALARIGFAAEDARIVTDQLIDNSLCGYRFAGLPRILAIARDAKTGASRTPVRVVHETPTSALVDGGLQDTAQTRYADFSELRGYCEKVAGAVGLACLPVYGSDDVERAQTLGVALQLINIVRDVQEDWELGRVYLPQDELAAHDLRALGKELQHLAVPDLQAVLRVAVEHRGRCALDGVKEPGLVALAVPRREEAQEAQAPAAQKEPVAVR